MKKILCPIDFSEASIDALNYADQLGKFLHADLFLFHAIHPLPADDVNILQAVSLDELEKNAMNELLKLSDAFERNGNGEVKYHCLAKIGFVADLILPVIKANDIDLIVMGTEGKKGPFKLFSTLASDLAQNAPCPVFIVPEGTIFSEPEEIVYATDLRGNEELLVKEIIELAEVFNAHISFVNVQKKEHDDPENMIKYGLSLLDNANYKNMSFHVLEKNHVIEGINDFTQKREADMLVMATYDRSFINQLFHKSKTKEEAVLARLPLLAVHKGVPETNRNALKVS